MKVEPNENTHQHTDELPKHTHEPDQGEPETDGSSAPGADAANPVERELAEMKDKYLRLAAEFENFRRRTAKERIENAKTATADLMTALLPVMDDFERAQQNLKQATDVEAVKEGVQLVFHKLQNTLQQKGLKAMESIGEPFDSEKHEAITQIPAPSPELKGKVVDEVEKGYYLGDKVIRYAKVVTGA